MNIENMNQDNLKNDDIYFEDGEQKWITLELEDGRETECAVMQIFKACNNRNYIALVEEDKLESGEPYFYRYSEDENGDPVLDNITDDDEWDIVCDAFEEILDDMAFNEMLEND